MPTLNKGFKHSAIYVAMLAATNFSFSVQAQDDEPKKSADEGDVEIIEIKGLRGSLKKSINDKRFASGVRDTINAEDVGKSTDQNIADALGRVTGVTVVAGADGEGSTISVRGADANQNQITLNGQTLTSTDFSQAVDLSAYSADTLSKLEVVKTPSADHDEGSLGGSVNLVTVRPLNVAEPVRSMTLQGRYNDFSEKSNHKLQLSLSEKFLDETLGVALTVVDETNAYRKDQYKTNNFTATRTLRQGVDQNGNVISNFRAIQPDTTNYELHQNESNRQGITLGIQFLPTDVSELMLDVNYNKQELITTFDSIQSRSSTGKLNNIEGEQTVDYRGAAEFSDPYDWYQVDTSTHTMTKRFNRYGAGNMVRSDGGEDKENLSATLRFETELTDNLRMSALIGGSKSSADSHPGNAYTFMENWANVAGFMLYDAGRDVEPVGFDCSTGQCVMVHGESVSDFGEHDDRYIDEDGIEQPGNWDNTGNTGFNPADTKTFFLGGITENDKTVEDEIKNAQIDFDWDIDEFGITTVEFGAKVQQRSKFVDNQAYTYTSVTPGQVIEQADGTKVTVTTNSMLAITGEMIAGEPMEYDNFMETLGYDSSSATSGWKPIDIKKARNALLTSEDLVRDVDNTKTRSADIDTSALYFKLNFEMLDGALTGDFGVRYVETEVEANGYNGFSFYADPNRPTFEFDFNRVTLRDLRNPELPECPTFKPSMDGDAYNYKYQRVDGLGWDTSAGPDPSTWVRIPDAGPCHDPNYLAFAEAYDAFYADETNTVPRPANGDYGITWYDMWRYADVRGSRFYAFDELPTWDGTSSGVDTTAYTTNGQINKSLKAVPTSNTHKYTNVLPSLNLNYAFSDEMIARFAISKTMTRPEIDLLRPGYSYTEGSYWGSGNPQVGNVQAYNTKLDPLESNNLDLSFEWYFSDTGMLSVAFYHKAMSNFIERQTSNQYIVDVKEEGANPPSVEELILPVAETDDGSQNWGLEGCQGVMTTTDFAWWSTDPTIMSDDLRDLCAQPSVTKTVNAEDASISGLEFGYMQTYDFLPGIFSGLGASANYTYQQSEFDTEINDENPFAYPIPDTPEHSYNASVFWEEAGNQIRISYRGSSDSLVGIDWATGQNGRAWNNGSIWNEGRQTIDLSANWQVTDYLSVNFQAINLTDEAYRTYFTSRNLEVLKDGDGFTALVEGNPLEGDAPTHRTYTKFKVGTTYRLGVRLNF